MVDCVYPEHSLETQIKQIKSAHSNRYGAIMCIAEDSSIVRQLEAAKAAIELAKGEQ